MIKVEFDEFMAASAIVMLGLFLVVGLVGVIVMSGGWAIIPIILVPLGGYTIAAWDEKRGKKWWR